MLCNLYLYGIKATVLNARTVSSLLNCKQKISLESKINVHVSAFELHNNKADHNWKN